MDFINIKVHVIGIGGIGVSGLARFLKAQGAILSGSDIAHTTITKGLEQEGITINIPHAKEIIADKDIIIHSAIIKDSNIEIQESKRLGKMILSRKEALKILLKNKQVLSICAAHGKSSTSAILSAIMKNSGAIIGAISKEFHSNVRVSTDKLLVFEADESDKSFLNSNPYKSIVINAEAEHLESYEYNFENLKNAYKEFICLAKQAIVNMECETLQEIIKSIESTQNSTQTSAQDSHSTDIIKFYPSKDIRDISYSLQDNLPYTNFSLRDLGRFQVYGIGLHNAINASLAILSALDIIPLATIKENLLNFTGIKKRFDVLQYFMRDMNVSDSDTFTLQNIQQPAQNATQKELDFSTQQPCIIDDYAHHPTEIKATLSAARIYADLLYKQAHAHIIPQTKDTIYHNYDTHNNKHRLRITAIFQPHKYSRLRDNLEDFRTCFTDCDSLVILPVWAAGEEKIDFDFAKLFSHYQPIFAKRIQRIGKQIALINNQDSLMDILDSDIIIGLGAGDITYQLRGEK
ncbi:UDP-N-acetylmuramate--L-alanine ligase [Helicobacter aurati]|uniref:UDP-N-acetylmuramate--L-alanine ligase n=1 Tax=Helicobacter aurati TaxID=137778 RepID=A0A3D8J945_9HELI|nr:Mur ligase domain-containing protein [Helicobacter aurati]RDU73715.1 UDP-N-acetylmuramate--L-alanine ligase [Helicobacter aurati]